MRKPDYDEIKEMADIAKRKNAADLAARSRARRLERLHPAVYAYLAKLSLEEREALNFVYLASLDKGGEPVPVDHGDLARAIHTSPGHARVVLTQLVERGHITRLDEFYGIRFRPNL